MKLYPWDSWFLKERFVIKRGLDYKCSQSVMAQQIRNAAVQRDLRVSLEDLEDGFLVVTKPANLARTKA